MMHKSLEQITERESFGVIKRFFKKRCQRWLIIASLLLPLSTGGYDGINFNYNRINFKQEYSIEIKHNKLGLNNKDSIKDKILDYMASSNNYLDFILKLSDKNGLSPEEICSIIQEESNWNCYAVSKKGCIGLMQLNPIYHQSERNLYNPHENIKIGASYLRELYNKYSKPEIVYAAYNAGPVKVDEWIKNGWKGNTDGIPFKETRKYVKDVVHNIKKIRA